MKIDDCGNRILFNSSLPENKENFVVNIPKHR